MQVSGYSSACGSKPIRFSYATNNVTPTGKRLPAGYVQKRKHYLTPQLAIKNTSMWFNDELLHT